MKAALQRTEPNGRASELYITAESELEAIALRAWWEQRVQLANGADAMPLRVLFISTPKSGD